MHRTDIRKALRNGAYAVVVAAAMVVPLAGAGSAGAAPPVGLSDAYVYSPSMNKQVLLKIIRPNDTSRPLPTLYLLNGAAGGEEEPFDWLAHTDVVDFVADKKVNVVIPIGGRESYYTDWLHDDPVLGRNKWTTFFTKELPPRIDSMLGTTGNNAIAGLSMAGTSVLALAESAPGLYKSVSSYSGCASTSDPIGQQYVKAVVETRGGGSTLNMWGPAGGPAWIANDAFINAPKLRGTPLYISSGNGVAGPHDNLAGRNVGGDPSKLAQQVIFAGAIEAGINQCTQNLRSRLDSLGIPATYNFRVGTHSWDYWQDDLHASWPMISASLGV